MEENKITSFFKQHFWTVCLSISAVILAAVTMDRWMTSKKQAKSQDYFAIHKYISRQQISEPLSSQSVDHLEMILNRRPELHPQYDTLLSLSFLHQERAKKAVELGQDALKRGEHALSPYFVDYAKTSLLITEGKLAQALEESKKLEVKLNGDARHEILHAFNLLRMACLGKKLQQPDLQKKAFERLQTLSVYPEMVALFTDGTFTLKELLS